MKIFALSDLHIDYPENKRWLDQLSDSEWQNDILILAGDISDRLPLLEHCFTTTAKKFHRVLYVPGNHDLWVHRNEHTTSIEKYHYVLAMAEQCGVEWRAIETDTLAIIAVHGWYDYSFGPATDKLRLLWMDYRACAWPEGYDEQKITDYFIAQNNTHIETQGKTVITCSHFLPRIDLMPDFIPEQHRLVYPVLGANKIDQQLRKFNPSIHIYGHSHVNVNVTIDGITYINNAFAYPHETRIARKRLKCVAEV